MMKHFKTFFLGILAGFAIALGGLLYLVTLSLSPELKILGSFLFSIGLTAVCALGLKLYTGQVGYIFNNKPSFLFSLLIMLIGNAVGAIGFGYLLRLTNLIDGASTSAFFEVVNKVSDSKLLIMNNQPLGQTWFSGLIMSFFCGMMVFLGVHVWKITKQIYIKVPVLVIAVAIFVACGFNHCIADMFYLAIGNKWASHFVPSILAILIYIVGNSLGSLALFGIFKLIPFPKKEIN